MDEILNDLTFLLLIVWKINMRRKTILNNLRHKTILNDLRRKTVRNKVTAYR